MILRAIWQNWNGTFRALSFRFGFHKFCCGHQWCYGVFCWTSKWRRTWYNKNNFYLLLLAVMHYCDSQYSSNSVVASCLFFTASSPKYKKVWLVGFNWWHSYLHFGTGQVQILFCHWISLKHYQKNSEVLELLCFSFDSFHHYLWKMHWTALVLQLGFLCFLRHRYPTNCTKTK